MKAMIYLTLSMVVSVLAATPFPYRPQWKGLSNIVIRGVLITVQGEKEMDAAVRVLNK